VSVSRKNLIEYLKTVDYVRFSHIKDDWKSIIQECEQCAVDHPDYCWSLVLDETFEEWDSSMSQEMKKVYSYNKAYGYTSANTVSWKTTCKQPQLHMSWEQRILDQLPLIHPVSTPTLQRTGDLMPWHKDRYYYFKQNYPSDQEYVIRFLLFPQNWQIGHFLQVGNSILSHWMAGDVVVWHPDRMHLSVNVGMNNKWTCNITGILTEEIPFDIPFQGLDR
jgi:hypothetical protein